MADFGPTTTITSQKADVTGDGVLDTISITGNKVLPPGEFIQNLTLVIVDGANGSTANIPLGVGGYNPRLFIGDFNCDGVADILVSIDSGGSGGFGFYYIFSYKNDQLTRLFDWEEFNQEYKFTVEFLDYYRVRVYSQNLHKTFIIDVSDKKDVYAQIYGPDGKLLKPVQGFVPGLNTLYPAGGENGCYDLLAILRIAGLYNADVIGYIEITLRWDKNKNKFVPIMIRVEKV